MVVNEAMNGACAVLASDECGSAPELVIDGETGFTYPAGDNAALRAALATALADPDTLRAMARQARAHVAGYDATRIAAALRAAIGRLRDQGRINT